MPRFLILVFLAGSLLFFQANPVFAVSFVISNPVIDDDDDIEVDASISGLISSSCSVTGCYLQGALRTLDESKSYFGFTKNNSNEYVDYFTPESSDEVKSKLFNFVPTGGSWSGKLNLKNNFENNNYLGPGNYSLRLKRFSGNSKSSSGDSNLLTVELKLSTPTPTPSPTPNPTNPPTNTPTPSPTASPTLRPITTPIKTLTPSATPIHSISPTISPSVNSKEVLAIKDEVKEVDTKEKSNILPILVTGVGILMVGLAAFPFVKSKLK